MKVALLEDHPDIVELIDAALDMQGHEATAWASGPALLASLLAESAEYNNVALPFDLLIVDYLLPGGMNGGEVIAAIRKQYAAERLPIILLSGANPAALAEIQTAFPDITLIQKPFAIKALLAAIQQASNSNGLPAKS
jgi:CheY-like chemotaxis protein